MKWLLQKTNWGDIYHEVTDVMNETTFMLVSKKKVICCEKSFFSHLCTDGWLKNFYCDANRDCLEEQFIVCNFMCTNLFDEITNKPVNVFDLCSV